MIAMFVHVLDDRAVSYVTTTVARKIAESGTDVVIVAAATTPGGLARAGDLPVVDLGGAVDNKTSRVVVRLARWLRATQVSVNVPGETTRVTSRLTMPLALRGSST